MFRIGVEPTSPKPPSTRRPHSCASITCMVTCSPLKGKGEGDGDGAVLVMEEGYRD
jgi:hypothetical protein